MKETRLIRGAPPLQEAPGVNKGRFKDKGLAALIKALGNVNPGLVVLTSRQEVPELEGAGPLVIHHALEKLSEKAGADLLVELGVTGRQKDLEAAVHELEGHAMSVTLSARSSPRCAAATSGSAIGSNSATSS